MTSKVTWDEDGNSFTAIISPGSSYNAGVIQFWTYGKLNYSWGAFFVGNPKGETPKDEGYSRLNMRLDEQTVDDLLAVLTYIKSLYTSQSDDKLKE